MIYTFRAAKKDGLMPTPEELDEAEEKALWAADHAGPLAAGIVGLLAVGVALHQYRRAHHKHAAGKS